MSYLTRKQSIGLILKSFSETDFLTLKQFLEAIYTTLIIVNDEELSIEDTFDYMDQITLEMDLSMDEHIQAKRLLRRSFEKYAYYLGEKFYNEFVTDEILRRLDE